jgi:hypothetical protein
VTVVGALTALWLGVPSQSQADPLIMNLPEGQFAVTGFDPGPGNLLITGIPTGGLTVGTVLETFFQANMSAILGTNNNNPIPGLGLNSTYELAVVARFTELVTSIVTTNGGKGAIASFALNPVQANPFFEVWFHNGILTNNLAGTGFAVGTKVLSGLINNLTNSSFNVNDATVQVAIDNPPPDGGGTGAGKAYWKGTTTVTGTGNNTVTLATMQVNSVVLNPQFFPANQTVNGYTLRPSTGLEYQNVDPSQQFDALSNGGGFTTSIPTGIINGLQFPTGSQVIEIDDKESVSGTATVIPEPSTMVLSLLGVGVLGCARAVRRRREAKA